MINRETARQQNKQTTTEGIDHSGGVEIIQRLMAIIASDVTSEKLKKEKEKKDEQNGNGEAETSGRVGEKQQRRHLQAGVTLSLPFEGAAQDTFDSGDGRQQRHQTKRRGKHIEGVFFSSSLAVD